MAMKRMLFAVGLMALVAPFAALAAEGSGGEGTSPAQACRAEQTLLGPEGFKTAYGTNADKSNAFGKCVSKKARGREKSHANAVSACRAEQADTAFAASHGGKTFDQFYGTGKNGSNAFGKCVSSKAKESNDAADAAVVNAAKTCKAERATDAAAFRAKYGKNTSKSNALGKCVSQTAKTKTP
jgi:hypothetical protein